MYLTTRRPQWLADMNPKEAAKVAHVALKPIEDGTQKLASRHSSLINRVTQRNLSLEAGSGLADVIQLIIAISHYAVQFGEGTFSMTRVFERIAKAEDVFSYAKEALILLRVIANKATWGARTKYLANHARSEMKHPLQLAQDAYGGTGTISNLAANTNTGGMGALTILANFPDQFATAANHAIPLIEQALDGHTRQHDLAMQTTDSALRTLAENLLMAQYNAIKQANQNIIDAQNRLQQNSHKLISQAGARGELPNSLIVTEQQQAQTIQKLADAKQRLVRAQAQFAARSYAVAGTGEAVMAQWELASVTSISLLSAIDIGMLVTFQGMREFTAIATAMSQRANQQRWDVIAKLADKWYAEDLRRAELQEASLKAAYGNSTREAVGQLRSKRKSAQHQYDELSSDDRPTITTYGQLPEGHRYHNQ